MTDLVGSGSASAQDQLSTRPLAGRTIVVTRSREQASKLSQQLRALGATVIEIPAIAIEPPRSWEPLDAALRNQREYDWLIVTSANTAHVIAERRRVLSLDLGQLGQPDQPRTVAVGPATAAALEEAGLRVHLVPQPAVAESIVAAVKDEVRGRRVLLVRAEVARDLLPVALEQAGAQVTIVDAYRTILPPESEAMVAAVFGRVPQASLSAEAEGGSVESNRPKIDALTFTSSSTVTNLFSLLSKTRCAWPEKAKVFSIGPVTSGTLREHGVEPDREANRHDVEGLVESIVGGFFG